MNSLLRRWLHRIEFKMFKWMSGTPPIWKEIYCLEPKDGKCRWPYGGTIWCRAKFDLFPAVAIKRQPRWPKETCWLLLCYWRFIMWHGSELLSYNWERRHRAELICYFALPNDSLNCTVYPINSGNLRSIQMYVAKGQRGRLSCRFIKELHFQVAWRNYVNELRLCLKLPVRCGSKPVTCIYYGIWGPKYFSLVKRQGCEEWK